MTKTQKSTDCLSVVAKNPVTGIINPQNSEAGFGCLIKFSMQIQKHDGTLVTARWLHNKFGARIELED